MTRAWVRNGISHQQLRARRGFTQTGFETSVPGSLAWSAQAKKSPSGASTEGFCAPSQ